MSELEVGFGFVLMNYELYIVGYGFRGLFEVIEA